MIPQTAGWAARKPQRGGIFFRLLLLLCFLCLLFVFYLVRRPLLRLAGGFWIVDETPAQADAIILLGDDNFDADRAARAAQLYKAGWAPHVVASGRYLRPYATIAELEEHDLEDRGVAAASVVRFPHKAANTREETAALGQLISSHRWKRILLVTSNYHTRRSRYLAERQFPPGTMLRVVAAPDSDYDPQSWWRTRNGVKIFAYECVGMLVSMWEMRHNDVQTTDFSLVGEADRLLAVCAILVHRPFYSSASLYYSSCTSEQVFV
jgi:uncharacterized SAM-binding protein YcdF (DUF218 family)